MELVTTKSFSVRSTGGSQGPLGLIDNAPNMAALHPESKGNFAGQSWGTYCLLCCAAAVLALVTVLFSHATSKSIRLSIEDLGMSSLHYPVLGRIVSSTP
ncbi:membrane-associated protein, putative [Bodo saltans]|uniref:Membrane-associated protein, putative n=1 Tax=Bodo saltans TaxID=75058 RepID=A0A0S4IZI6_BODSA|nr:membrane-associated protein, putative [Bodo saltans]|eukprot:CUG20695.1 membrane-associated protein, putative [Bodo saltans]